MKLRPQDSIIRRELMDKFLSHGHNEYLSRCPIGGYLFLDMPHEDGASIQTLTTQLKGLESSGSPGKSPIEETTW